MFDGKPNPSRRPDSTPEQAAPDVDPGPPLSPRFGEILALDAEDRPLVDFPGNPGPPCPARILGFVPPAQIRALVSARAEVLLGFEDGVATRPIIMSVASVPAAMPLPTTPTPTRAAEPPAPTSAVAPRVDAAPAAAATPSTPDEPEEPEPELAPARSLELRLDGERYVLEAERDLELRCGNASILLRQDGTIKLRGRDITTWARRRQRIRGGSVSIN